MVPPKLVELYLGDRIIVDVSPKYAFSDGIGLLLQISETGILHGLHIAGEFAARLNDRRPGLSIGLGLLEDVMTGQRAVIAKPLALVAIGVRIVGSSELRATVGLLRWPITQIDPLAQTMPVRLIA